jgi:hypothetical protein
MHCEFWVTGAINTHTHSHTHSLTLTLTHTHSHLQTHTHTNTHSHLQTRTLLHTHTLTHSSIHTHTHTHIHSHLQTHTYTHTLTHAHNHTHSYTLRHSLTHTKKHTPRICNNYCFSTATVVMQTHLTLTLQNTLFLLLFYKQEPKYFGPHSDQAAGSATEQWWLNCQKWWKFFTSPNGLHRSWTPLSLSPMGTLGSLCQRQSDLGLNLTAHLHQVPQVKNIWIWASTPSYCFKSPCFI